MKKRRERRCLILLVDSQNDFVVEQKAAGDGGEEQHDRCVQQEAHIEAGVVKANTGLSDHDVVATHPHAKATGGAVRAPWVSAKSTEMTDLYGMCVDGLV